MISIVRVSFTVSWSLLVLIRCIQAGTIGTGLFLGTGSALAIGGPASLLLTYSIIGFFVYIMMCCICEFVTELPVAGTFFSNTPVFTNLPPSFRLFFPSSSY
jgi:AAT family amino acid transporter